MSLTTRFLTEQREEAMRWSPFLDSLHPDRTATLVDVLENGGTLKRLGLSDVIDRDVLQRRIVAYCDYINRVPGSARALSRGCLIFFQSNLAKEDNQHRTPNRRYDRERQQVRYFHTETNWTPETIGDWDARTRLIRPGYSFSNDGWRGLHQERPNELIRSGSVVGYRIPLFTELLGISRAVATEYIARVVIHDLGHAHLPNVEGCREPLHDVAMIHAMNAHGNYTRDFQGVVHRECTDPFFFLDPSVLWEISTEGLNRTQRFYLLQLQHKYSAKALPSWAPLFDLTDDVTYEGARAHVTRVLHTMRAGHYERYREAA